MQVIPRTKRIFVWQYSNNQLRELDSVTPWVYMATPVTYAILNQLDIVSEIEGRGLGSPGVRGLRSPGILGRIGG